MDDRKRKVRASVKGQSFLGNKFSNHSSAIPTSFVVLEPRIILDAAGATTAFTLADGDAEFGSPNEPVNDHQATDLLVDELRDAISAIAASEGGAIRPTSSDPDIGVATTDFGGDGAEPGSLYILHGGVPEVAPSLTDAMADASRRIADYLSGGDGLERLYQLFPGSTVDRTADWDEAAGGVLNDILAGNLELRLEVRESADLLGAYGAFAASGPDGQPVVYLNAAWLLHLSEAQISALIIEETGHWIDHALNGEADTRGDEGEAFAAKVFGRSLSDVEQERIASEIDVVRVNINGVMVQLEFAALLFSDEAYFVQTSTTVIPTQLETSAVYTTSLVGSVGSRYLFVSNPPEAPVFSGNNTQGYLYVVNISNVVTATYFGEVTRLFKNGSAVTGLQFFVYPAGYTPGSGDRSTPSDISILIDLGANFALNQTYKTSSDPIAGALNALLLLASGGAPTANADTDSIQLPSCSGGVTANQVASGNVLAGTGSDGNISGADADPDTTYSVIAGVFTEVQGALTVTSATSSATGASAAVAAGTPSTVAGAFGSLTMGADGSYSYTVNATLPALVALPAGQSVTELFTYSITDAQGGTSSTTLTITINGGNDAPIAANDYQLLKEGTATPGSTLLTTTTSSGSLLLNDRDVDTGATLKITRAEKADGLTDETFVSPIAVTDAGAQTFSNSVQFTYSRFLSANGWGATVGDAVFLVRNGTVLDTGLTVASVATTGAAAARELGLSGHIDFVSGDNLRFGTSASANNLVASVVVASLSNTKFVVTGAGLPSVGSVVSGEGVTADTKVATRSSLAFGATTYTYITLDKTVTVSTTVVNSSTLNPGETLISLSGEVIQGTYGFLNLKSDGSYSYVLTADVPDNQLVNEYFTYEITDTSCTDTAVLHLQIQGNQVSPPNAVADTVTVVETGVLAGTSPISGSVLSNDSLGTGSTGPLNVTGVWTAANTATPEAVLGGTTSANGTNLAGSYGSLTVGADGSYTYALDNSDTRVNALPAGATLAEVFYYRVADSKATPEASITSLTITIQGANDAPIAANDTAVAVEKGGFNNTTGGFNPVGNVLVNDSDVDVGNTLTVSKAQLGSAITGTATAVTSGGAQVTGIYGALTLKADGTYGYAVNDANAMVEALKAGQSLTETFTYEVIDDGGATATATLTITINGADDVVAVSNVNVNEASPWAVFTVTGSAGQLVKLALATTGDSDGDATFASDFGPALEYLDGTNWVAYTAGSPVPLDAAGKLLVRAAIRQDEVYEGQEAFLLNVTTSDLNTTTGVGVIFDDGTGDYFADDNNSDTSAAPPDVILDDDRKLSLADITVNEASPYAVFTVTAFEGQVLDLVLGSTADETDADAMIAEFSAEYSTDGGATWTAYNWDGSTGDRPTVPASGTVLVRVDIASEADTTFEGAETFTLTASPVGGKAATGTATIVDDGTGTIFNEDGTEDTTAVKDDDRALTINDVFVNEASPYAVFRVSAQGGQVFSLSLEDGPRDGALPTDRDARIGVDYGQVGASGPAGWGLEVFNGVTWQPYAAGEQVSVPDGGTVLLVRVPIINDDIYKGEHTFFMKATYVSEGVAQTVRGEGVIGDLGTGATFNNSGATVSNPVLDDDRSLRVNSLKVNEGSSWAVFTISGIPDQELQFTVVQGSDADSASLGASPTLQVWNGAAWQNYNPAVAVIVPESATVLVRVGISAEQDTDREGAETFGLRVVGELNGLVLSSDGLATIYDDGTGVKYPDTAPEILAGKPSPVVVTTDLDDDFDKDGIAPNVEEALATLSASQGKGAIGDLNGDGIPDAEQSALATLAWITRDDFVAGLEGNLARVQPIVSVKVVSGSDGTNVDATAQLASIEVVAYETAGGGGMPVPRAGELGASNLEVTWDPIRFAVEPGIGADGVPDDFSTLDIDPTRKGVQIRIYIDVENTGLREGDLNAYLKFVSQDAVDAAGAEPLRDLEGRAILQPGWFDFTRKQDSDGNYVGDGARFVIRDGRIVGIELIITDNAFGDNDPSSSRILDPGVPVRLERAPIADTPAGAPWPLQPIQRKIGPDLIPPGPPPAYVTYITEASRLRIAEGFATTTTYWGDPLDPPWRAEQLLEKDTGALGQNEATPAAILGALDAATASIRVQAHAANETIIEALEGLFDNVVSETGRAYEARMLDGTPLPSWIEVDAATGVITVDAPGGYAGVVEIRVTVRDAAGRVGVVTVSLEIDQQQSELSDEVGSGTRHVSEHGSVDDDLAEMLRVVHALSEPIGPATGAPASGFSMALAAMSVPAGLLQFPAE